MQAHPPPLARLAPARRYQLRTGPAWRVALERLRALGPALASHTARGSTRALLDAARVVRSLSCAAAPERVRLGLPPERGDLDGWLRAGIVDAIAGRAPGRLDAEPDAHAYRQGHAAALLALYTTTPLWAAEEPAPMTQAHAPQEQHDQPSDVESESTSSIRTSRTVARIALALAKAQGEFESVIKAGTAKIKSDKGDYAYRYADLASVIAATRPALAANGIAVVCAAETVERGVEVSTRLIHASGEWIESARLWMACDARPQNVGSAITYARRYQLLALLGLAPEDDDAATAQESADATARPPQRKPPRGKSEPKADPLARERAELQALVASLAERDSVTVSAVWTWATRAAGLDGLALAVLDAEAIGEVGRVVRGKLAPPAGKRAAKASAPAKSSPEHAGKVATIMRLAETIHMARPAEERDDSIDVLIGHSADALARLDAHELGSIEARLRSLYAHEVGEDAP